jgi:methylmalonyl-CoA mutase N-terminal domain/subunit
LNIDDFAPRLSFFFNSHNDFFEEIAKFRAARKIWAETMQTRYGARDERSMKLRFHAQTAGCSLTWQQPYNNVVRTSYQALAAVLGGCQSLHTNSLDEAYALPSEKAVTLALRTQQILAHETGVPDVADPLGGSYFLEALTAEMERRGQEYITAIDNLGGMIPAIERGYPQQEIADASYRYQRQVESGQRPVVGVTRFATSEEDPIEILRIEEDAAAHQKAKLVRLRAERSSSAVSQALCALRKAADGDQNLMPFLLDAVKAYATVGEICDCLKEPFGIYQERAAV